VDDLGVGWKQISGDVKCDKKILKEISLDGVAPVSRVLPFSHLVLLFAWAGIQHCLMVGIDL